MEESKDKPAGRDGVPDQEVIVPQLEVGVAVVIAVPLVKENEDCLYAIELGATSFSTKGRTAVSLPPVLLAVTV